MSADAMRAALEALLDAHARNTLFSGAGHWEQARAALAQPTSAERVPLTESRIFDLLSEHTTYDLQAGEEPPLVEDNYGSRRYASRFINFVRAIERAHGIGEPK
jgi:hypothetical protein